MSPCAWQVARACVNSTSAVKAASPPYAEATNGKAS